jgi:hypothetical protein
MPGTRGRGGRGLRKDHKESRDHVFFWKPYFRQNLASNQERTSDVLTKATAGLQQEVSTAKQRVAQANNVISQARVALAENIEVDIIREAEAARRETAKLLDRHEDFLDLIRRTQEVKRCLRWTPMEAWLPSMPSIVIIFP